MQQKSNEQDFERIDETHIPGVKIIQNKKYFCYGLDAVLLQDFALKKAAQFNVSKICDLCTGNAIIPIIMCFRNQNKFKITAVELQPQIADMAERSVLLNNLQDSINVVSCDLKDSDKYCQELFDMVTVNPPYMIPSKSRQSSNQVKMIARQEIKCTLQDVIKTSSQILKKDGILTMVHRFDRVEEIKELLKKYDFALIEQINILPQKNSTPTQILLAAQKNAPQVISFKTSNLITYTQEHTYTEEIKQCYIY